MRETLQWGIAKLLNFPGLKRPDVSSESPYEDYYISQNLEAAQVLLIKG